MYAGTSQIDRSAMAVKYTKLPAADEQVSNVDDVDDDTSELVVYSEGDEERVKITSSESELEEEDEPHSACHSQRLSWIPGIGMALVFVASIANSSAAVVVKMLRDVDVMDIITFRGLVILCLTAPLLCYNRVNLFPKKKLKSLAWLSICSSIFNIVSFLGFRYLPLGDARTLSCTLLIFVTVLGRVFLNEPCGLFESLSILVTISGVIMITHPPFIFGEVDSGTVVHDSTYFAAALTVMFGSFFLSCNYIITRTLSDVHCLVIQTWMAVFSIVPSLAASLVRATFSIRQGPEAGYAMLGGVFSFFSSTAMTLALQVEEAGTVSVIRRTSDILVAFAIQIIFFGEVPGLLSICGSIVITLTVVTTSVRTVIANKRKLKEKVADNV